MEISCGGEGQSSDQRTPWRVEPAMVDVYKALHTAYMSGTLKPMKMLPNFAW
jgi:hypothetical protein